MSTYCLHRTCERFGVEPDGDSSRFSTVLAESYHYARLRIPQLERERDRMRELLESAEHWLTLPPTTGSDHYCVEVLCREIRSLVSQPDPLASVVALASADACDAAGGRE